jgi:hypothetical protein
MSSYIRYDPAYIMTPIELRNLIKGREKDYIAWMRDNSGINIPSDQQILEPSYPFVFKHDYKFLNFHPEIRQQAQDMLGGSIDRQYSDASSGITIHDYIGHIASSQTMCWNVVLPMKKHDNFTPLFEALSSKLVEQGIHFDFGIETAEVLELNVGQDLGEGNKATSIDLYLRTAQGKVCAIEFKFTEEDFGHCKLPGDRNGKCNNAYGSPENAATNDGYLCYLAKIGRRYWQIGGQYGLVNPTQVNRPCPMNTYYQALRNLMVAKKRAGESLDGPIKGIFVLVADERNSAFWGPDNRFDAFKDYLKEVRGREVHDVFRISIQDIVGRFSGSLKDYKDYFSVKYGFEFN